MWAFRVAEEDFTLRDCVHTPLLFKNMFPDSSICQSFSMAKSKVSCIFRDGLGLLLLKWICQSVHRSSSCFTIMFDEATTEQKRKQMDTLVRYWGEGKHLVVTKYLGSLTFCCATAVDITKMFTDRQDNKIYDLPWARLFNISADRPNINKAIWRSLNEELQARNHKGLIEFINCTLHTVHNVFRKSVASHGCGEVVEQYAFDLHAWFKVSIFCTSVLTLSYPFLYKLVCGCLLNTDRV